MASLPLPETILLEVIWRCDVPTLKNLRLAHRILCNLISAYENSTARAITSRLFSDFEVRHFYPLDDSARPVQALFALEYRIRTTRWLSAVAVENRLFDGPTIFDAAVAARGWDPQALVPLGWSVMWHLADIARTTVHAETSRHAPGREKRGDHAIVQELESLILERQLKHISTHVPWHVKYGYYYLHFCLQGVFRDRILTHPRRKSTDCRTALGYALRHSWLNWIVLRKGPELFARAWASELGNQDCSAYIEENWLGRGGEQISIERTAAEQLEEALLHVDRKRVHDIDNIPVCEQPASWATNEGDIEWPCKPGSFHLGYLLSPDEIRHLEWSYRCCE